MSPTSRELLQQYIDLATEEGLSAISAKGCEAYCRQSLDYLDTVTRSVPPEPEHVIAYAEKLWLSRARETTIRAKVNEIVRFCRWVEMRAVPPGAAYAEITSATIVRDLKREYPERK